MKVTSKTRGIFARFWPTRFGPIGFAALALLAALSGGAADATNLPAAADQETVQQGRAVYLKYCMPCHGPSGDGRGEMGLTVRPRPRDFGAAVFKYRSTPSGFLPTDDDLARTIHLGLTGTAMPTFQTLRESEVRTVIAYVKSFSSRWRKVENYAASLPLPAQPNWFDDADEFAHHAAKGKALFITACAPCHGSKGDGRGDPAREMKDSFDEPVTPHDLSQPLRCGPMPKDIYRTLVTGLDGTPMPTFLGAYSEVELWEIIAHNVVLRREEQRRRK